MIPKQMKEFLYENLPEVAIMNRLKKYNGKCYMEFGLNDEHLLSQIGIITDKIGPKLVACIWDEKSPIEIGGYLIVDNLSMGHPSMGGIRMLPDIKPVDIYNLARGMTLKNAAAQLPYGGGKAGIIAERDLSPEQHEEIIIGFARLIKRYESIYVPGPDVGTNDSDMKTIAIENGLDSAVSKPADMGGNRIDELGSAAGGVVIALETLLDIIPRLQVLPQFANLEIPDPKNITILIQGFGAVGAHTANMLIERIPNAKTIGISDIYGYLYNKDGLPIKELFKLWKENAFTTKSYFKEKIESEDYKYPTKFSTNSNNLLREDAFCLIPAAPVFNYVGFRLTNNASMLINHIGKWSLIVEGANTYSPDPNRKAARIHMEQIVYQEKGIMIATDYLVNSGGVIFAAQEHIVKTPAHLQIPKDMLGDREAVNKWLEDHSKEFSNLSKERLDAGIKSREGIIHNNMIELVDLLTSNPDILPCAAAEQISLKRLKSKESKRTVKDLMVSIPKIDVNSSIEETAKLIVEKEGSIVAVLSNDKLVGVVTTYDITKATAEGISNVNLEKVMTKDVIKASPDCTILDIVREFEQYQISAMPVVKDEKVLGKISSDLITQRYILEFL